MTAPGTGPHAGEVRLRFTLRREAFLLEAAVGAPGQGVTGIFGPSGSGKTTLLRCVAGLERAPDGYVAVNGDCWQNEAEGCFTPTHRRAVGYVFQEPSLFPHLTVRGNLGYGLARVPAPQRRVAVEQAVAWLGLEALLPRRPHGLSGGERQRVAIARALLASPRLLLMDEPLASLDAASKAEILPYLERLFAELSIPVLYVSHATEEVTRLASHLVLLEQGRVLAQGPLPQLLARLDLPLAHGEEAGAVVQATVAGHDAEFALTTLRFPGGMLEVPRQALLEGRTVRLRIAARDVSLTLAREHGTSILNILPVTVLELAPEGTAQMLVRLDAGGTPLLARITRKSAQALGLRPGLQVFAQVKSAALVG